MKKSSGKRSGEGKPGLRHLLGELESEVLECVWNLGEASVKDVHGCLLARRQIAYTTVMTVMTRLTEKGLLARESRGRAFLYTATSGKGEFCAGVVKDFVREMLSEADRPVLANFVDGLTDKDAAQLEVLADIIEQKRREQQT